MSSLQKNLRGGKMEDVIFAGTEIRKPMGFARVYPYIFDNADRSLNMPYDEGCCIQTCLSFR